MIFFDLHPTMIDISKYQNRNSHSNSGMKSERPLYNYIMNNFDITLYRIPRNARERKLQFVDKMISIIIFGGDPLRAQ